jgi:predicted GIY-YIG superfamily endonuclease
MLVHSEQTASRSDAIRRERSLKSGQGRAWLRRRLGC